MQKGKATVTHTEPEGQYYEDWQAKAEPKTDLRGSMKLPTVENMRNETHSQASNPILITSIGYGMSSFSKSNNYILNQYSQMKEE